MGSARLVVFSSGDLAALRRTLHSVWDAGGGQHELVVLAGHPDDETVGYLARQFRRGTIASFGCERTATGASHCDLDRASPGAAGQYVARVSDDIELRTGWLDTALDVMDAISDIGCLGLIRGSGKQPPGKLRALGLGALRADDVDTRCFVTRRRLFEHHDRTPPRGSAEGRCAYQARLQKLGFQIAYLPGLVNAGDARPKQPAQTGDRIDGDLVLHDPLRTPAPRIRQTYELGEEVLLTCVGCGNGALDVLAAEVELCADHDVPVGHTYTLHCHRCGSLQFEEDLQIACQGGVRAPRSGDRAQGP